MGSRNARIAVAAVGMFALVVAWIVRPVFHGLIMSFWTQPLVWLLPLVVLGVFVVIVADDVRAWNKAERGPRWYRLAIAAGAFLVVLIVGFVINGALVGRSIYTHTNYEQIASLPSGGQPRLLPKEVAENMASSGFNSSTERLTEFHITRTPGGGQSWTALRTPNTFFRTLTKKTQGIVALDASQTARNLKAVDAEFKYAPGLQITDSLRWRLLKKHYLITLAESVGISDARGHPLIVVPYLEYKGFLVRRPVLGGVFVVHPDGRIEDLPPEQAVKRPELVASGRLFPEMLARKMQDAYAYKKGIANRVFSHVDQTQITDTEVNQQPYLIDFGSRGSKWVTVAEPYGRAFAANAIFLTDTVTGKTQVWTVPKGESLTGNRRALETVRSVSIPGVVFANSNTEVTGSGRFRTVEPRPVFVDGRLVYLISIIPESGNSVSKTVIVDAERNKVTAIFDNDSDQQADAKILRYLKTGVLPGSADSEQTTETPDTSDGTSTSTTTAPTLSDSEVQRRIESLVKRQRELLKETQDLQDALNARSHR